MKDTHRISPGSVVLALISWLVSAGITVYGVPKLFAYQFVLFESTGDHALRDVEPMWLAWAFFGHSYFYGAFLGVLEILAGGLLLVRRTRTLGAVLASAIMSQVVIIDAEFEIYGPLGIAILLLLLSLVLVASDSKRILAALGALTQSNRKARVLPTAVVVTAWIAWIVVASQKIVETRASHQHELRGGWSIEEYLVDGETVPLTGGQRISRPSVFFEFARITILALDGTETQGLVEFGDDGQSMRWTMDFDRDAEVFEANIRVAGDEMILSGTRSGQDVSMRLARRERWRPVN